MRACRGRNLTRPALKIPRPSVARPVIRPDPVLEQLDYILKFWTTRIVVLSCVWRYRRMVNARAGENVRTALSAMIGNETKGVHVTARIVAVPVLFAKVTCTTGATRVLQPAVIPDDNNCKRQKRELSTGRHSERHQG